MYSNFMLPSRFWKKIHLYFPFHRCECPFCIKLDIKIKNFEFIFCLVVETGKSIELKLIYWRMSFRVLMMQLSWIQIMEIQCRTDDNYQRIFNQMILSYHTLWWNYTRETRCCCCYVPNTVRKHWTLLTHTHWF